MYIWKNYYKFFLILSFSLIFMASACSKPSEDKTLPDKDTTTTKVEEKEVVKPQLTAPETPATEPEKPEVLEIQTPEPPVVKTIEPEPVKLEVKEPVKPEPIKPEPVQPEPVQPKPVKPEPVKKSEVADVIAMQNPAYKEHKKGIVLFPHKKHVAVHSIGCGECHHDEKGAPLNNLKFGDKVANCIACHAKTGQAPRIKDKPKLTKKQKRAYHAEAIHEKCIVCHKAHNKENNTKAAPSSCSKCHPKRK
jgi:Class III cytochrome C family